MTHGPKPTVFTACLGVPGKKKSNGLWDLPNNIMFRNNVGNAGDSKVFALDKL